MSLYFDFKQYYRIVACLSLMLGLAIPPSGEVFSQTAPGRVAAPIAKQKAKISKPRKSTAQALKSKSKTKTAASKSRAAKTLKHSKPKAAVPAQLDPVAEMELIDEEALGLRNALGTGPDDGQSRQKLSELALRAARGAERALSRGDESLFGAYRELIRTRLADTRPGLEAMAARGVGAAEFALGTFDLHGFFDERSVERACPRFAAALDKGFGGARFRHAQCIEAGEPARALTLFREAASSGHVAAIERLGRICLDAEPPDATCAFEQLERAAREGRASARSLLGWMHAEGIGGKVDLVRAAQYYREASALGEASARNNLGEFYERGRGVAQDEKAAFEHYLAAAQAGFPPGQFNVGRLYVAGRGTAENLAEARRWLNLAAKAGIVPAQGILDMLERQGGKP
jgi:hypothetical protein